MICIWKELLNVLPIWMRKKVDQLGPANLREIRLRMNAPPELVSSGDSLWLHQSISQEDLNYTINASSRYSPWTMSSAAKGYLTIDGGHRIGLCGEAIVQQGMITGVKNITSVCIRVAKDFPGVADMLKTVTGSVIILGAPGWGKTTLLRDLIRQLSDLEQVSVVDERGELFPSGIHRGKRVDVLQGCPKAAGISMLMRTMGPGYIGVDEITDPEDVRILLHAANCGVKLLATAHAASFSDLKTRNTYSLLLENHVFDYAVLLRKDQSYTVERMTEWTSNGSVQY